MILEAAELSFRLWGTLLQVSRVRRTTLLPSLRRVYLHFSSQAAKAQSRLVHTFSHFMCNSD